MEPALEGVLWRGRTPAYPSPPPVFPTRLQPQTHEQRAKYLKSSLNGVLWRTHGWAHSAATDCLDADLGGGNADATGGTSGSTGDVDGGAKTGNAEGGAKTGGAERGGAISGLPVLRPFGSQVSNPLVTSDVLPGWDIEQGHP